MGGGDKVFWLGGWGLGVLGFEIDGSGFRGGGGGVTRRPSAGLLPSWDGVDGSGFGFKDEG